MKDLTSKEVYHLILKGAADGGWQGFALAVQKAYQEKNDWYRKALDAKQARIDELMLEYCPDEITDEQWEEYKKHQVYIDIKELGIK